MPVLIFLAFFTQIRYAETKAVSHVDMDIWSDLELFRESILRIVNDVPSIWISKKT